METLNVNTIYPACEGEGVFIGQGQVFVRLQGCDLHCKNCDSKETWPFQSKYAQSLTVEQIVDMVREVGPSIQNVSITGGDPTDPRHFTGLLGLLKLLKKEDYFVNIEASGNRVVPEIFRLVNFISFDFKTPCTGVETNLGHIIDLNLDCPGKFQVKSVIETQEDFYYCKRNLEKLLRLWGLNACPFPWVLTPAYNINEEFPRQRFVELFQLNLKSGGHFRVIGQQHKWIYGPNESEV